MTQPSAATGTPELASQLRQVIAASDAGVAVAYRTLDGRDELLIDADKRFHAASTMKVPVMIDLFAQVRAGRRALTDRIAIRNEFRSIVDGSPYGLNVESRSESALRHAPGGTLTLAELCEAMITASSNLATNLLIEELGVDEIRGTVHRLGADAHGGMQVLRGVEDSRAFENGINNSTTARGLLTLFEKLAHGDAVDEASDTAMIAILARQTLKDGIPAGLPAGTRVAHKTGNITRIHHDAGIVYGPRPYVLVVLVGGLDDRSASGALIAELSRLVYAATHENTAARVEGTRRLEGPETL